MTDSLRALLDLAVTPVMQVDSCTYIHMYAHVHIRMFVCLWLELSSFCAVSRDAAVHFDFLSLCTEQFAQLQSSTTTAAKFPCDESGEWGGQRTIKL